MPPRATCIMPRSRESLKLLSSIFIAAVHVVWTFVFGQDAINNVSERHQQSQSVGVRPARDVHSELYGTPFSSTTPGSTRTFSISSVSVHCIVRISDYWMQNGWYKVMRELIVSAPKRCDMSTFGERTYRAREPWQCYNPPKFSIGNVVTVTVTIMCHRAPSLTNWGVITWWMVTITTVTFWWTNRCSPGTNVSQLCTHFEAENPVKMNSWSSNHLVGVTAHQTFGCNRDSQWS